jgi:soluble lytic murein transglycosylase-like protein
MRQLDLEVPVPPDRADLLADTAGRLGVSLSELLTSSAAAYARKAAAGSTPRGSSALRRTVGWGARPAEGAEAERVPVRLGPEVLDLIEAARRSVRWEAADGSTAPVSLEEYVLGAAERMIRTGSLPTRKTAGEGPAPALAVGPATALRSASPTLRWVLLGAGALTAVFLVVAVVLVVNRRPAPVAEAAVPAAPASPAADGKPLLPPPGSTGQDPKTSAPASPGDPRRAGEAVSRWERQADASRPRSGRDHTQQIDGILAQHLGGNGRQDGYAAAIDAAVRDVADLYPVPPALVKAVIRRESAFNPRAKSRAGAIGLMQVMPFNARKVGLREAELWDPERNILGGTRLLAALLRYYNGDMVAALAAYNAKPRNPFAPLPNNGETPEYVTMVLRYYDEYARQAGPGLGPRSGTP